MLTTLFFLAIIAVAAFYLISIFNTLVKLRNRHQNAFAQIEVSLKRRYDLIPNLVATAKGYLRHERETLQAVTEARKAAQESLYNLSRDPSSLAAVNDLAKAEGRLGRAMAGFNLRVEAYPELKGSANMMQLSEELISTENQVGFARQAFNDAVMAYNTYKQTFPPVFFASVFGHGKDAVMLEFADSKEIQAAPSVQF